MPPVPKRAEGPGRETSVLKGLVKELIVRIGPVPSSDNGLSLCYVASQMCPLFDEFDKDLEGFPSWWLRKTANVTSSRGAAATLGGLQRVSRLYDQVTKDWSQDVRDLYVGGCCAKLMKLRDEDVQGMSPSVQASLTVKHVSNGLTIRQMAMEVATGMACKEGQRPVKINVVKEDGSQHTEEVDHMVAMCSPIQELLQKGMVNNAYYHLEGRDDSPLGSSVFGDTVRSMLRKKGITAGDDGKYTVGKEFLGFVAFRIQEWIMKKYGPGTPKPAGGRAPAKSRAQLHAYIETFVERIDWPNVTAFDVFEDKADDGLGSSLRQEGMQPLPQNLVNLASF